MVIIRIVGSQRLFGPGILRHQVLASIEFARHYGTVILPTKPAMPRHKGKVEAAVKYAQNNAVAGRTFTSLGEQNLFLAEWERTVADTRIHGTTRQQVGKLFVTAEQSALRPLPAIVFPVFEEAPRTVHRDGLSAPGVCG